MDEHLDGIDNLFEKAVQRHAELPTGKVWEQLEKNLQKRKVSSITRKYKKWRWVAAALFILFVGLGIYTLQLTWKYKKEIYENKPGTPDPGNRNNHVNKINPIPHGANPEASSGSSAAKKDNHKQLIENSNNPKSASGDKSTVNEESIAGNSTVTIEKDNSSKIEKQKAITNPATDHTVAKENQNGKLLSRPLESIFQYGKETKQKAGHKADVTLENNIRRIDSKSGFSLYKVSSPEMNSTAVSPEKENVDPKASILSVPIDVLTVNTSVIPLSNLAYSAPFNNSTTKSGIRLKTKNLHPQKWTAGTFYSEHVVSTGLQANHPDFREDNYLQIKSHEKNRASKNIGVTLARKVGGNLSIVSGISLTTYITDINRKPLVARKDNSGKINYRISTSSGYAYYTVKARPQPALADSIQTLSSKSTVKYVSIPVGLQYNFYMGNFGFTPSVSIYVNFKSAGSITTIQSLERTYTGNIEGLKSHYLDGNIGLGMGYYVNKKIIISLIPSARLALSPATEKNPVISQRRAIGLAAGLYFAF